MQQRKSMENQQGRQTFIQTNKMTEVYDLN